MKNKFTHFLMAGALVCWSSYTLHAQTEVTDTYLKNPSFESNFTDWDNAGMQTQTNTSSNPQLSSSASFLRLNVLSSLN